MFSCNGDSCCADVDFGKTQIREAELPQDMSCATPSKKKTSPEQLVYMVDFLSENKILVHGKTKPSEANNNLIEKLWDELTASLNAIGSGPHKTKIQWKKTFIVWKCHTKKKARECLKSEQKTGGGEADIKKLTPTEEKLMALLSWIAVRGADVNEVGFEEEDRAADTVTQVNINVDEPVSTVEKPFEMDSIELDVIESSSLSKRPAAPIYSQIKRTKQEKSNNLQRAAETYAVGQKETASILNKLLEVKMPNPQSEKFLQKELELKEIELKIRLLEAKNKTRELDLKERELIIEEKKIGLIPDKI